ncbi:MULTISPECIES: YaaL family protein [unclassified Bacillus (in: firmicutes)]|uniref:YaaL family protein n=1 Tax=unclassified Bacillus (in: firmicutes) TaxID=185979 RepID=UPI001BE5AD94|nr:MULTISPECIES: YaaL family protein [unclassified Bacillus (in: firmicutes)]MBT2639629.1 YaaL family protein [Bacillus sp. ISL-39]MBT2662986.1 YaaL family protein [Bacillus sp. ISL-45]
MLFRKKKWLRKEFDHKLLAQLDSMKRNWNNQKLLVERSFDPSEEFITEAKIAEAKYFFLFKEAKHRKITIKTK